MTKSAVVVPATGRQVHAIQEGESDKTGRPENDESKIAAITRAPGVAGVRACELNGNRSRRRR